MSKINFERSYVKKIKELKELSRYVDIEAEREREDIETEDEGDGNEYRPLDQIFTE